MGGKKVGAADVARAASQMVHETGAEPLGYVRSNTGDPPSAFDSYAQTNLKTIHQYWNNLFAGLAKQYSRFTASRILQQSVLIANPLLYNRLDCLLQSLRIELLAVREALWPTKYFLAHDKVGRDTLRDRHTKPPEHKGDNTVNLSGWVRYAFASEDTLQCWCHISCRNSYTAGVRCLARQ